MNGKCYRALVVLLLLAWPNFWINSSCDLKRPNAYATVIKHIMMTSSNGNIFRVTGPLWGAFTGQQWISLTKASNVDVFFDLHLNKRLSKNRDAGDLRRNRAHYDVTVMSADLDIFINNINMQLLSELLHPLLAFLWWHSVLETHWITEGLSIILDGES